MEISDVKLPADCAATNPSSVNWDSLCMRVQLVLYVLYQYHTCRSVVDQYLYLYAAILQVSYIPVYKYVILVVYSEYKYFRTALPG